MSIPLVQEATKDAINTSIIAIKRNIERINMLLGLMDSGSPDLSGLATKQELQDAITELTPVDEVTVGNMHSVTSNAVAESQSLSINEQKTGGKWIDGRDIYKIVYRYTMQTDEETKVLSLPTGIQSVIGIKGMFHSSVNNVDFIIPYVFVEGSDYYEIYCYVQGEDIVIIPKSSSGNYFKANSTVDIILEYTKTN